MKRLQKINTSHFWLALKDFGWKIVSYPWLMLTGLVMWIFMYRLNKTIIVGKENLPYCRNRLIISNHLTMIDSWFISMVFCWPQAIKKPLLVPWNLPEEKNFMRRQPLKLMCQLWQCIPLNRGTGDLFSKMPEITDKLRRGSLMIFPEGTRSRRPRGGVLYRWTAGSGRLAYETKATVIPVAIRGIEDVLPVGRRFPHFGKKIIIVIGRPITELTEVYSFDKKTALSLISDVMKSRLQRCLTIATYLLERNHNA